ncbi:M17 family metallopeptidase [Phycisphaerales bacterium AB-hyl4]|uniref:Probable cytosol aminopeptidase n=1 Tax=Natronomicrosphaera hydrolytica TaxID=3242702 RepID=A0ABV4U5C4_9BACT
MYRDIRRARRAGRSKPDAVAVFLYERADVVSAACRELDRRLDGAIADALKRREVSTARGRVSTLYPAAGADRLLICGLGKAEAFDANALRLAATRLLRAADAAGVQRLEVSAAALADDIEPDAAGAAIGDGFAIARFDFNAFKGAAHSDDSSSAKAAELNVMLDDELAEGFDRALAVGQGQRTARELAATPPNVANPAYVVDRCRKLAREVGLRCTVIDAKKAEKLGMGGISAVGRAGSTPPALIALEWPGRSRSTSRSKNKKKTSQRMPSHPVMLVGKAVTFDTGGYSLKVGGSMQGMKYDKCGGMTVIGVMEAVARLKLDLPVVGLIPAVENMIDEQAYRVDDIIKLYNGVTVEVTNTDAEGRLILADALAYGTEHYQPRAVLDLATLTGGVVVALGSYCAGLWCNDDDLNRRLETASTAAGERLWRMPLWNEHRDQMKSTHADLTNSADREAHPIQGAAFLSYFVGDKAATEMPTLPWAHIDIAGVASVKGDADKSGLYGKGPTGFGVRLLTELLREW